MTNWIQLDPDEQRSPKLRAIIAQFRAEIDGLKARGVEEEVLTDEMIDAGWETLNRGVTDPRLMVDVYLAMRAARPKTATSAPSGLREAAAELMKAVWCWPLRGDWRAWGKTLEGSWEDRANTIADALDRVDAELAATEGDTRSRDLAPLDAIDKARGQSVS